MSTLLAIVIGALTFGNYAWYANGGVWLVNVIIQILLAIGALLVFLGYRGPKHEKWVTWVPNSYWNIRRGIQAAVLIATVATMIVMMMHLQ